jgi:ABC-type transport system substrate-binding protein
MEIIDGRNAPGRRRFTLAPAVALVTALVLSIGAGVSGASTTTHKKAEAGGTLTWAIQTNPASLFDAYYFSSEGSQIFSLVQDHILAPGTFGQPTTGEGSVSSSWKEANSTTYVYTIKKGIKFSDGSTPT